MKEVDTATLARAWESGAAVLDVREDYEYAEAHVPRATWIPLGELPARVAEIPPPAKSSMSSAHPVIAASTGAQIVEAAGREAVSVAGGHQCMAARRPSGGARPRGLTSTSFRIRPPATPGHQPARNHDDAHPPST